MTDADTLRVTTPGDREIAVTRVFEAPREQVFAALTRPDLIQRWLSGPPGWSLPVCEIDLKVGGRVRFVWRGPYGTEIGLRGVYREIAPPERLVHTELFDQDWTGGETVVTTLLHEDSSAAPPSPPRSSTPPRRPATASYAAAWSRAWPPATTGSPSCWRGRRLPEASAAISRQEAVLDKEAGPERQVGHRQG
jgi:uncharacterized protein YndB with AHSA1/START domain